MATVHADSDEEFGDLVELIRDRDPGLGEDDQSVVEVSDVSSVL